MILKSASNCANYRALFQSLTKSMFCNCIYNLYNVNFFINDEFINDEFGYLKYKMFGGCIQIHALCWVRIKFLSYCTNTFFWGGGNVYGMQSNTLKM